MTSFFQDDESELNALRAQVAIHERESGIQFPRHEPAQDRGVPTYQVLIFCLALLDIIAVVAWLKG